MEQGRYTYVCKNGQLEPTGCLSDSKEKVAIGGTFIRGIYQLKCVLKPDGHINVEYSACVHGGRVITPGGTLEVDSYWISCDQQSASNTVVEHISGCVNADKKRMKKGEKLRSPDGVLYECRDQSPFPKVDEIGCVSGGKDYLIGQTITDSAVWYVCHFELGKVSKKAIGCVFNGQTQYDGQVYSDGSQLKQCRVGNKTNEGAKPVAYGCVRPDGLKGFGCHFTDGQSPNRVLLECQKQGDAAVQVPIKCVYQTGGYEYFVDSGCYQMFGNQGVGCKKVSTGLQLVTFASTELNRAAAEGIKLC